MTPRSSTAKAGRWPEGTEGSPSTMLRMVPLPAFAVEDQLAMSGANRHRVDKQAGQTHFPLNLGMEVKMPSGKIRAGMGGWTFEPWDTSFYPDKLSKAKQLNYASRQVPTIEVNGTYYSTFKPPTFAKWAADAPDGFVFSLKAIRFSTNRRVLAEAGESVQRFLGSGVSELGDKLGPILWQF